MQNHVHKMTYLQLTKRFGSLNPTEIEKLLYREDTRVKLRVMVE